MVADYEPPVLTAEWAPGLTPADTVSSWTALPGLVELSVRRGQSGTLGRTEPASATLVFEVGSDVLDPEAPGFPADTEAWTPLRITASYDGDDYPLFMLCTTGSPVCTSTTATARRFTVECTDYLGWMAQLELPSSKLATAIASADPVWWAPGYLDRSPGGNGDGAFDWMATVASGASAFIQGANAGRVTLEDDPITPGGDNPSIRIDATNQLMRATGATSINPATQSTFMVAATMQVPSTPTGATEYVLLGRNSGGTALWGVYLTSFGPAVVVEMRDTAGNVIHSAAAGLPVGEPFLLRAYWSRTSKRVEVRVDADGFSDSAVATSGSGATAAIGAPNVDIGHSSWRVGTRVSDVALFDDHGLNSFWPTTGFDPAILSSQSPSARLSSLLRAAGLGPTPGFTFTASGMATLGAYEPKSTLGEAVLDWAEGQAGGVVVGRDDEITLLDWLQVAAMDGAEWLFSDEPTPGPFDPTLVRYTDRARTGGLISRVVNDASLTADNGGRIRVIDLPSKRRHGTHRWDRASGTATIGSVSTLPGRVVAHLRTPPWEVTVTVEPWGDHDATVMALTIPVPFTPVDYSERSPASGVVMAAGLMRAMHEDWTWRSGTEWSIKYRLEQAAVLL